MKTKIINLLLGILFLFSCSQPIKNSQQKNDKIGSIIKRDSITADDSVNDKLKNGPIDTLKVVHYDPIKMDTVLGDIHISYIIRDNDRIISSISYDDKRNAEITNYADRSIFINFKRGSKNILSNLEIRKTEFLSIIPKNEINNYKFSFFEIKNTKKEGVTFTLGVCKPDTDICYYLELFISNQGIFTFKEIDDGKMED